MKLALPLTTLVCTWTAVEGLHASQVTRRERTVRRGGRRQQRNLGVGSTPEVSASVAKGEKGGKKAKPTPEPTVKETMEPTAEPTMTPTVTPTMSPTVASTTPPVPCGCELLQFQFDTAELTAGILNTTVGNIYQYPVYDVTTGEEIGVYQDASTFLNNELDDCNFFGSFNLNPNEDTYFQDQIFIQGTCSGNMNAIVGGTGMYACYHGYDYFDPLGDDGMSTVNLVLCGGGCASTGAECVAVPAGAPPADGGKGSGDMEETEESTDAPGSMDAPESAPEKEEPAPAPVKSDDSSKGGKGKGGRRN
jgi:hypothetical protein